MSSRTALVTGASSGIGRAVARSLAERGWKVIGTSRDPAAMPDSARLDGVEYLPLDLGDQDSVERCATAAGEIDVLVNNAGESQMGVFEEISPDALRHIFQVNVLGPVRLTQLLLPGMRSRGSGRVVMVGSMLASFPLAFRSSYVAAKSALKGFANGARRELSPYGVWITTVEPGSIATGIGQRRTHHRVQDSPYADEYDIVADALVRNEKRGITADRVAEVIGRAIDAERPKPLYAVGSRAPLVFTARRLLPRTVLEKIVARAHGLR